MPEIRPLPELRRRYFAVNLLTLGTAVVSFGYLFFNAGSRDGFFWVVAGIFVASTAACLLADRIMVRRLACPSCGQALPKRKPPRGKFISVQYHCPQCQVIWDTEATEKGTHYSDPL